MVESLILTILDMLVLLILVEAVGVAQEVLLK